MPVPFAPHLRSGLSAISARRPLVVADQVIEFGASTLAGSGAAFPVREGAMLSLAKTGAGTAAGEYEVEGTRIFPAQDGVTDGGTVELIANAGRADETTFTVTISAPAGVFTIRPGDIDRDGEDAEFVAAWYAAEDGDVIRYRDGRPDISTDLAATIAPSRTSIVEGEAVQFEATGLTGPAARARREAFAAWDFGEGGTFSALAGNADIRPGDDSRYAWGRRVAHVFRTPGTHTVTLTLRDRTGRPAATATVDITVAAADSAFYSAETIVYAPPGEDTSAAPASDMAVFTDWNAFVAELGSRYATGTGQTRAAIHNATDIADFGKGGLDGATPRMMRLRDRRGHKLRLEGFGTGVGWTLRTPALDDIVESRHIDIESDGLVIQGLRHIGGWDPTAPTTRDAGAASTGARLMGDDITVADCELRGWRNILDIGDSDQTQQRPTVANCILRDHLKYVAFDPGWDTVFAGCDMGNPPETVDGPGEQNQHQMFWAENPDDGGAWWLHDRAGAPFRSLAEYTPAGFSGSHVWYLPTQAEADANPHLGGDGSPGSGTIEPISTRDDEVQRPTEDKPKRNYVEQGPIRAFRGVTMHQCRAEAHGGWSAMLSTIEYGAAQPICRLLNRGGEPESRVDYVLTGNDFRAKGDAITISNDATSYDQARLELPELVMAANRIRFGAQSTVVSGVRVSGAVAALWNNLTTKEDMPQIGSRTRLDIGITDTGATHPGNRRPAVFVRNDTWIDLQTAENAENEATPAQSIRLIPVADENANGHYDIEIADIAVHHPALAAEWAAGTGYYVDVAPIDTTTGALGAGSAGIGGGSLPAPPVDRDGTGRADPPNLGALAGGGGFSPGAISGLRLWLDAQDSATITGSPSVSAWGDKSGNGRDHTQADPLYQPTVAAHKGRQWIYFQDAWLLGSDGLGFTGNPGFTVFIVAEFEVTLARDQPLFGFGRTAGVTGLPASNDIVVVSATASDGYIYRVWGGYQAFSPQVAGRDEIQIWQRSAGETYGDSRLWLNGGAQESATGSANPSNTSDLGDLMSAVGVNIDRDHQPLSSETLQGWIGEIIVYDGALTAADMNAVGEYLGGKWGIAWAQIP